MRPAPRPHRRLLCFARATLHLLLHHHEQPRDGRPLHAVRSGSVAHSLSHCPGHQLLGTPNLVTRPDQVPVARGNAFITTMSIDGFGIPKAKSSLDPEARPCLR